jgi:D-glycero-alpha-D-manno-heptose-7-phosphate kinase
VISFAINLYSRVELLSGDESWHITTHALPKEASPQLFYAILDHFKLNGLHSGIRLRSSFDGIIGSGLASSASATIALLGALYKFRDRPITDPLAIAKQGWELEKQFHHTGQQDHYATMLGGMNSFVFHGDRVRQIAFPRHIAKAFEKHIVLCYIGGTRVDTDGQRALTTLTPQRIEDLNWLKKIAYQAERVILDQDWKQLGILLAESWELKKQVNTAISTPRIDAIYELAMQQGALGGKLCGSGQGGYMIFLCLPAKQAALCHALGQKYRVERVDYEIDFTGLSCRLL